jgi:2-succinyl-5-enolpyruvyl-6-hydroxy-3-cyclohexene-1-carboxylate synthase
MSQVFSSIPLAQNLVELCVSKGIHHVVVSPGSRCAPLVIGFCNHPKIKSYSIVDERCAAFFALGMAQQTRKPMVLVCTSGSALLNYYPAIAEAFYSDIPLVVISADRPEHLIDIGDGQTIRQPNVFQNHILYSASLKNGLGNQMREEERVFNELEINSALNIALEQNGPVHLNAPFDEPLYNTADKTSVVMENKPLERVSTEPVFEGLGEFIETWNTSEKKMILVGVNFPGEVDEKYLDYFGNDESVLVFMETTSNLHHPNFFPSIDSIIAPIEKEENADELFKKLQPEILLTFGGMVVSKKVKAFLRKYPPKQHFHIDPKKAYDTFFCLSGHFKITPNAFFEETLPKLKSKESGYRLFWDEIKAKRKKKRTEYLKQIPFSDFKVFELLLKNIPDGEMLQIGNSSAIRYAQLFDIEASVSVFCNRGTSGIDGSVSTAVGAALASKKSTTLITGDLGFFYDSNGLWNNHIPENFKIIVVNNGGGGIFRILPGNKQGKYFDFLETPHHLTAEHLAKMYGFVYEKASGENELVSALEKFYSKNEKQILEIFTPREINDEVLLGYFEFLK